MSERLVQRSCDAPRRIGIGPPERLGGLVVLLVVSHQRPPAALQRGLPPVKGFVDRIPKYERDRVRRGPLDYCHRMRWRWPGWSRLWKAWPESLPDAADSG